MDRRPKGHVVRRGFQAAWDFVGIPFRLALFPQHWLPKFGWTTLEDARLRVVWPHLRGELLDIGAGPNTLVRRYTHGVGVDVFDWGGGAQVVRNTAELPFEDRRFDTITFVACLNHIPNRRDVLREAERLLAVGGTVVITMIGPVLGAIGHTIWWYAEDRLRGGMLPGEVGGLSTQAVVALAGDAGLVLRLHRRFVYGMNNLYVFERRGTSAGTAEFLS